MPICSRVEPLECRRHFAATFGGAGFDNAQRVATAADGTYVVAGLFSGLTNFDQRFRLRARGDTDIYLAKYSANDTLLWVKQIGGATRSERSLKDYDDRDLPINPRRLGNFAGRVGDQPRGAGEYVNDIAIDTAGNVVLAGAFRETITVGGSRLTADATIDEDFYDAMVVKFTPAGDVTWARQFGGPFDDVAQSVGFDRAGNPFVGGYFTRQADFDPTSNQYLLRTVGRDAGYVMRMTAGGAMTWVYRFDSEAVLSTERNAVNDIAVTPRGDVYLAGTFGEEVDFDPSKRSVVLEATGLSDSYLARIDRRGRLNWALSTGGDENDGNVAVALDAAGNVYTAGYFVEEVDVDPRPGVTRLFEPADGDGDSGTFSDLLISRFAPDGTPAWQAQLGGDKWETIGDLKVGPDGAVTTVGAFYDTADFAPGRAVRALTSLDLDDDNVGDANDRGGRDESYDGYVSRLSPRGKFVSAERFGATDDDFISGVAYRPNGTLLVGGRAVRAVGEREDRDEQTLLLGLTSALKVI
jgi:hypothetical protein